MRSSSVHDISSSPTPPFGSRFLTEEDDVWAHNAWDHVPPPDDQGERIASAIAKQQQSPVSDEDKKKYNEKPAKNWDNFYKSNTANFFRDRKWLHNEFPELVQAAKPEAGQIKIVEIGCGAGNSIFPVLSSNQNPSLQLYAYDYSSHAVKLVQQNSMYNNPPVGSIHAAVWDLSSSTLPDGLEEGSVEIAILVFVLSALHPDEWDRAVKNIYRLLRPGGTLLLRDYGRYDLTQLRFKSGRLLDDNFYIRGDKTRVYFFELDELSLLFSGSLASSAAKTNTTTKVIEEIDEVSFPPSPSPLPSSSSVSSLPSPSPSPPPPPSLSTTNPHIHHNLLPLISTPTSKPLFETLQLGIDRRLIVNRKRQLKMYRVWMQGKFRKIG